MFRTARERSPRRPRLGAHHALALAAAQSPQVRVRSPIAIRDAAAEHRAPALLLASTPLGARLGPWPTRHRVSAHRTAAPGAASGATPPLRSAPIALPLAVCGAHPSPTSGLELRAADCTLTRHRSTIADGAGAALSRTVSRLHTCILSPTPIPRPSRLSRPTGGCFSGGAARRVAPRHRYAAWRSKRQKFAAKRSVSTRTEA